MNIEYFYKKSCEQKSDINEHLPVLFELAKECKTIAEFGVRSVVSSFAFAHAKPDKLICVDIEKHENVDLFLEICKKENIDVEFHLCDSRKFEFEPVDLVFIDTLHTYTQLKQELEVLGNKAKKYLVFHDTITFGNSNENNIDTGVKTGLVPAISEFLKENKNWKELKTYINNNGLTILINKTYEPVNPDINCVWIGDELSIMERLSLILAKNAGYNVILWSNSEFENVPDEINVRKLPDDILPPIKFNGNPHPALKNGGIGSLSQWSDYFAYEILYRNGGYWMQLDFAILNKLNITNSFAFTGWSNAISPVFMKMPKGSEYTKETINAMKEILKNEMKGLSWEHSMNLMHNFALKHKIYDDCKIIDQQDGYYDCGGAINSPYNLPLNQPLSFIHWSNATNYYSKKEPVLNSEYYNLCKKHNLL